MNGLLKALAEAPVLGYAIRWVAALVRLPNTMRSQGESIRQVHDWVHQAGPSLTRIAEVQARQEAQLTKIGVDLEEVARIAREAHAQASWLTGRHLALAESLEKTDAQAAQLRAGLDRHLPTILQQLAAQETHARNLKEWLDALARSVTAQGAHVEGLSQAVEADRAGVESLAARAANAELAMGRLAAAVAGVSSWPGAHEALAARAAELERRVSSTAAETESTRTALAGLQETTRYLLNRVEFVRRETLFELRYGEAPATAPSPDAKARIVSMDKVERGRRDGLRLNLGCGHIPLEGYVNVDIRELPGVDVIAQVDDLPFDPGSVAELFSAHLLEHFPREQLRRELLPYWRSLIADGGVLRAVVPDAATMIRKYGAGEMPWEDLREVTFGGQDYSGDFHFDMFTPDSLGELLREAGFSDLRFPVVGRANGRCYEMEVVATK